MIEKRTGLPLVGTGRRALQLWDAQALGVVNTLNV